jgi:hypothetical protein
MTVEVQALGRMHLNVLRLNGIRFMSPAFAPAKFHREVYAL